MNEFRPFRPNVLGPCARTAGRSCKLRQKRRVNLMFLAAHNNTAQAYNNNDFFSLSLWGHSLTTLTKFCPLHISTYYYYIMTINLTPVDNCVGRLSLLQRKICIHLTFPVPPTYLVLST